MTSKTKTTSMILTTTTIALLAVVLTPIDVYANHTPWYGGPALTNSRADMYFHSSLNNLSIDGSTNQFAKAKSSTEAAMTTYTNIPNSDLILATTSTYGTGKYVVYAGDLGFFGPSGEATYPDNPERYVRYNTQRSFGTTGGCSSFFGYTYAYNLQWLANHELGHTAGLAHAQQSETSTMVPNCKSTWSTVQSHDAAVLQLVY